MKSVIYRVRPNHRKKTFTIYSTSGTRYRTYPMSEKEFEENKHNTPSDWKQWLSGSGSSYYRIK